MFVQKCAEFPWCSPTKFTMAPSSKYFLDTPRIGQKGTFLAGVLIGIKNKFPTQKKHIWREKKPHCSRKTMRLTNSNEILTVKLITTREALITLVFQNVFQNAFHKHPSCKC